MIIQSQTRKLIDEFADEINTNKWKKIYNSNSYLNIYHRIKGEFNYIMHLANINPLLYISEIPPGYLAFSPIPDIQIPSNITSIGEEAFRDCKDLTNITIPDSVTRIDTGAFFDCEGLKSVTIGNGVTNIGDSAFAGCTNLTNITYQGTKMQWNALSKGLGWRYNTGHYTIHCTDGDIKKNADNN